MANEGLVHSEPGNLGNLEVDGGVLTSPLLLAGVNDANFPNETGFLVSEPLPAFGGYASFGVCNLADDAAAAVGGSPTGAIIGTFDTHDVGMLGVVSALQLDVTKVGHGDCLDLSGVGLFVWNQGDGNFDKIQGYTVGLESDGGEIATWAIAMYVQQPSIDAMADGAKAFGLYMENQTVAVADINYAINVNNKFFVGPDGGFIEGTEVTAPAAPAANGYRLYAEDTGGGKTRLVVKFATGAVQVIATQP